MRRLGSFEDLVPLIKPRATIVLHSGFAEPERLARGLAEHAARLTDVQVISCVGMGPAPYAAAVHSPHLRPATFLPGKALREPVSSGRAALLRLRLSAIPAAFDAGIHRADMVMLRLSPPDAQGRLSLGLSVDYMRAVLRQKPLVVAEIDPAMPRTRGDTLLSADQVDVALDADAPPWRMSPAAAEAADHRIADHVAGLVDSGCTIQTGIGAIPDLVLARLGALTDLGIHTGIITDAVRPLIERGVVTNARKRRFAGRTVSTMAGGSQSFYDFLDQNDAIEFHPCDVTHDVALLASIERLCAINSVLEIDLHGRANAERLDGRAVSAPGGLPDFAQGAAAAPGGRSIVALRATSRDGRTSRIRPALAADAPATIGPNCIDYVVTEFGVARLTGLGSGERARALAAVAHPDFRADLVRGAVPPRCVS